MPPAGDGYYYFSAYFVVWFYKYAVIDIQRNGQTLCTAFTDQQYPSNYGQSTCSAAVYATEGLYDKRRMHSSRMRNARLLSVSPSMHCFRGICLWSWGWECIPACNGGRPRCEQNSSHTLLKILPCPHFVVGGKYALIEILPQDLFIHNLLSSTGDMVEVVYISGPYIAPLLANTLYYYSGFTGFRI